MITIVDANLARSLNQAMSGDPALLAIVAANWLIYLLGALVFLPLILEKSKSAGRRFFWGIAGGAAVASAIRVLIGAVAFRPRPFVVISGMHQLIEKSADSPAFPSGHAAAAFAIAWGLFLWNRRVGIPALVLAAVVGVGRVAVGVHYPSDVIGGALLGILASWLVRRLAKK